MHALHLIPRGQPTESEPATGGDRQTGADRNWSAGSAGAPLGAAQRLEPPHDGGPSFDAYSRRRLERLSAIIWSRPLAVCWYSNAALAVE
jgi:hypothetical protein